MDRKEKNQRREKLKEYFNLDNCRLKDYEVEKLESLVENREKLDGSTISRRNSYKTFDSEDTYRVEERDTYTFRNDNSGIYIDRDYEKRWDDGQNETLHIKLDSAREILGLAWEFLKKK